jgi:glycosyltransferase involved in cell wall biosynthesis
VVPGFIPKKLPGITREPGLEEVRFLYSGALDTTRGVNLIFEALEYLPKDGWRLEVAGDGSIKELIREVACSLQWREKVTYHGVLSTEANNRLMAECHVGLNCQRSSDPVSGVTFPSKIFTYLSAGLLVISSKAGAVEEFCGNACLYYEGETPQSLAGAMKAVMADFSTARQKLDLTAVSDRYSITATTERLRRMLRVFGLPKREP